MVEGTTDTYKDIYDIFEGIAQVWDRLSDTQQARVAEILGGTRQLQVISSIIGNWGDAAGAYADAMDAACLLYTSSIEMGDNQTVHAFEAESLAGAGCGYHNQSGQLFTYTIFGANEDDAA